MDTFVQRMTFLVLFSTILILSRASGSNTTPSQSFVQAYDQIAAITVLRATSSGDFMTFNSVGTLSSDGSLATANFPLELNGVAQEDLSFSLTAVSRQSNAGKFAVVYSVNSKNTSIVVTVDENLSLSTIGTVATSQKCFYVFLSNDRIVLLFPSQIVAYDLTGKNPTFRNFSITAPSGTEIILADAVFVSGNSWKVIGMLQDTSTKKVTNPFIATLNIPKSGDVSMSSMLLFSPTTVSFAGITYLSNTLGVNGMMAKGSSSVPFFATLTTNSSDLTAYEIPNLTRMIGTDSEIMLISQDNFALWNPTDQFHCRRAFVINAAGTVLTPMTGSVSSNGNPVISVVSTYRTSNSMLNTAQIMSFSSSCDLGSTDEVTAYQSRHSFQDFSSQKISPSSATRPKISITAETVESGPAYTLGTATVTQQKSFPNNPVLPTLNSSKCKTGFDALEFSLDLSNGCLFESSTDYTISVEKPYPLKYSEGKVAGKFTALNDIIEIVLRVSVPSTTAAIDFTIPIESQSQFDTKVDLEAVEIDVDSGEIYCDAIGNAFWRFSSSDYTVSGVQYPDTSIMWSLGYASEGVTKSQLFPSVSPLKSFTFDEKSVYLLGWDKTILKSQINYVYPVACNQISPSLDGNYLYCLGDEAISKMPLNINATFETSTYKFDFPNGASAKPNTLLVNSEGNVMVAVVQSAPVIGVYILSLSANLVVEHSVFVNMAAGKNRLSAVSVADLGDSSGYLFHGFSTENTVFFFTLSSKWTLIESKSHTFDFESPISTFFNPTNLSLYALNSSTLLVLPLAVRSNNMVTYSSQSLTLKLLGGAVNPSGDIYLLGSIVDNKIKRTVIISATSSGEISQSVSDPLISINSKAGPGAKTFTCQLVTSSDSVLKLDLPKNSFITPSKSTVSQDSTGSFSLGNLINFVKPQDATESIIFDLSSQQSTATVKPETFGLQSFDDCELSVDGSLDAVFETSSQPGLVTFTVDHPKTFEFKIALSCHKTWTASASASVTTTNGPTHHPSGNSSSGIVVALYHVSCFVIFFLV
mmetsp:Transcript_10474/g.11390  ORF Transcript_10474/g.11390 Transcript_10474/m.11390 type:complete len:1038 (+) Transcript_10474:38-3151(+)